MILGILKYFSSSLKVDKRMQKKVKTRINNTISVTIVMAVLILGVYSGMDIYNRWSNPSVPDCSELAQSVDRLKKQNDTLKMQVCDIKQKFENIEIDKYPFKITSDMLSDLKSRLSDITGDIGASRASISLFHNPYGMGFKPVPSDGGKNYMYASILVSVSDGFSMAYDYYMYQNIQLRLFDEWFKKYSDVGYVELNTDNKSEVDKFIFKIILMDSKNVKSVYVFGIPNNGNVREYGEFVGVMMFDFKNKEKLDDVDKVKVKAFVSDIGDILMNCRK